MNAIEDLAGRIMRARGHFGELTPDVVYHAVYAGSPTRKSGRYIRPLPPLDIRHARRVDQLVDAVSLDEGWLVQSIGTSEAVVTRDRLVVSVPLERLARVPQINANVAVRGSAVSSSRSPGFLHRAGGLDATLLTRIYLNVRPPDAWVVLGPVVDNLARAGVTCDAKVLAHPSSFHRADSAVVYVPSEAEVRAVRIVERTLTRHGVRLNRAVPALTGRIGIGMAVADEPSDLGGPGEMSHGQWVTMVVMEVIDGEPDEARLNQRIEDRIAVDGRNPHRPHRRAASNQPIGYPRASSTAASADSAVPAA